MNEDAVSAVIGAMLLLAVGVTFFAAWNAYYVPSMKTQSEISHIRNVESGFLRFSSDIETAVSFKRNLRLSEHVQLGGGDFIFSPMKSGGELRIRNSSSDGYLVMNWSSKTISESPDHMFGIARFWYKPVNNFWQDQGYGWSYGNVYVINTERNLSTPLQFATRDDITYDLAGSLFTLESLPASSSPGNCSSITAEAVTIMPDIRHFQVSGNGNGMLILESDVVAETVPDATGLSIRIIPPLPDRFNSTLWDSIDMQVEESLTQCGNIKQIPSPDPTQFLLKFEPFPYPNMTLTEKTTRITIGAY
ncbi:MAG TPA: hypothetical protein VHN82_03780 [Methanoregula sp.]|nr:hypothetical protein [Methanoregula sp.]